MADLDRPPPALASGDDSLRLEEANRLKLWVLAHSIYEQNKFRRSVEIEYDLDPDKWKTVDKWTKKLTVDTRLRSFYIRLTRGILYGNKDFNRFQYKDRSDCYYCGQIEQTNKHLFLECQAVNSFRKNVTRRIGIPEIEPIHWITCNGLSDNPDNTLAFVLLMANKFVYKNNWEDKRLSVEHFCKYLALGREIEHEVAIRKGKLNNFLYKWTKIEELLDLPEFYVFD